jgi:hypothetical protein
VLALFFLVDQVSKSSSWEFLRLLDGVEHGGLCLAEQKTPKQHLIIVDSRGLSSWLLDTLVSIQGSSIFFLLVLTHTTPVFVIL